MPVRASLSAEISRALGRPFLAEAVRELFQLPLGDANVEGPVEDEPRDPREADPAGEEKR